MNICFFMGTIVEDVEFCFTLKKDPISIAKIKIQLTNKSDLIIYAFNELADYSYRKLQKGNLVLINGYLTKNLKDDVVCKACRVKKL